MYTKNAIFNLSFHFYFFNVLKFYKTSLTRMCECVCVCGSSFPCYGYIVWSP